MCDHSLCLEQLLKAAGGSADSGVSRPRDINRSLSQTPAGNQIRASPNLANCIGTGACPLVIAPPGAPKFERAIFVGGYGR